MSIFKGRDYSSLKEEFVEYMKSRLPSEWNYNNPSDPLIILLDCIAHMADNVHYYIDSMRRESDMSTAQLQSSVYSYALREGYNLLLPRSSYTRVKILSNLNVGVSAEIHKFDQFKVEGRGLTLYASSDYSFIAPAVLSGSGAYIPTAELVAGKYREVSFTYYDIDKYSRVSLPNSVIDGKLVSLIVKNGTIEEEWTLVDDVVTSDLVGKEYSLSPSFVNGVSRLYIEFPINYKNIFTPSTTFKFKYVEAVNVDLQLPFEIKSGIDNVSFVCDMAVGGFVGYESVEQVKANYKNYVKDYSALLTKRDYDAYVNYLKGDRFLSFDVANYGILSGVPNTYLNVRSYYLVIDLPYESRRTLQLDLESRSSRSDLIYVIPVGYVPLTIAINAKVDLTEVDVTDLITDIQTRIFTFFNSYQWDLPSLSKIIHEVHETSEYISKVDVKFLLGNITDECLYVHNSDWERVSYIEDEVFSSLDSDDSILYNDYRIRGELVHGFGYNDEYFPFSLNPVQSKLPSNVLLGDAESAYDSRNHYDDVMYDYEEFSTDVYKSLLPGGDYRQHKFYIYKLTNVIVMVK